MAIASFDAGSLPAKVAEACDKLYNELEQRGFTEEASMRVVTAAVPALVKALS